MPLGMGSIKFVAVEVLAVLPTPALRIVFASAGFGFADVAV